MDNNNLIFELNESSLNFDIEKSILLCKNSKSRNIIWAKKLNDIHLIHEIKEDPNNYYVTCEIDDKSGTFLAIDKITGSTTWFIPGRSFFQQIYENYIYIIFIDNNNIYYLIKVDKSNGNKIWYYEVDNDLCEYSFKMERILLKYSSGKVERISISSGKRIT